MQSNQKPSETVSINQQSGPPSYLGIWAGSSSCCSWRSRWCSHSCRASRRSDSGGWRIQTCQRCLNKDRREAYADGITANTEVHAPYLYRCLRLGPSSVLKKYLLEKDNPIVRPHNSNLPSKPLNPFRGHEVAGAYPPTAVWSSPGWFPVHCRVRDTQPHTQTATKGLFRLINNLCSIFLDFRRKPEKPEHHQGDQETPHRKNHAGNWTRAFLR